ncbi:MAG: multiheme c-type cytochrome [Polyangiales bacterium]
MRLRTEMTADEAIDQLADTATCIGCHQDVGHNWMASAHANASFGNPWYRTSIDRFRAATSNQSSRFCAGCHDPLLLIDHAIDNAVEGSSTREVAGITCLVCHSAAEANTSGNASYVLDVRPFAPPDPAIASEVDAHRRAMKPPPVQNGSLCGSCHRSFVNEAIGVPFAVHGIDDLGGWLESPITHKVADLRALDPEWKPAVEEERCQRCHMERVDAPFGDMAASDGWIASHRVAASHRPMADATKNKTQKRFVEDSLKDAITVSVHGVNTEKIGKRTAVSFDVMMFNRSVAHSFPSGTKDLQDTWLEVRVLDKEGRVLLSSGTTRDGSLDPTSYRLGTIMLDEKNMPIDTHDVSSFRHRGVDTTLPSGASRVVRFSGEIARRNVLGLRIQATVWHRKHPKAFQQLVCKNEYSARAKKFRAFTKELGRRVIDGCVKSSKYMVAKTKWSSTDVGNASDEAIQKWRYGLALAYGLQERLDEAMDVLLETLSDAIASRDRSAQGRSYAALAYVYARANRIDDAEQHRARAREALG